MEHPEQEPSRLVKINHLIRIIWGVITAILFLVLLIAIIKKETGY